MRAHPVRFGTATRGLRMILLAVAWSSFASAPVHAAENAMTAVLPAPACAEGWTLEEKAALFDKDTLYDHIDGEAELYFPYGFDLLASARYANGRNPRAAVVADVYRMGSLLDAFGMYANYRREQGAPVQVGAEGTLSSSQLIFYQGRYFVRLQATGSPGPGNDVFLACARAISHRLPENPGRPEALEAFRIPAVVRNSERYAARSLLGYDFFRRGFTADAVADGAPLRLFLVPEDSGDAASRAFDRYRSYLQASGKDVRVRAVPGLRSLSAVDPLYGAVLAVQAGRFLVGAVRVRDPAAAERLIDQIRRRIGGR